MVVKELMNVLLTSSENLAKTLFLSSFPSGLQFRLQKSEARVKLSTTSQCRTALDVLVDRKVSTPLFFYNNGEKFG